MYIAKDFECAYDMYRFGQEPQLFNHTPCVLSSREAETVEELLDIVSEFYNVPKRHFMLNALGTVVIQKITKTKDMSSVTPTDEDIELWKKGKMHFWIEEVKFKIFETKKVDLKQYEKPYLHYTYAGNMLYKNNFPLTELDCNQECIEEMVCCLNNGTIKEKDIDKYVETCKIENR